jgi:hypothetical protein
MLSGFPFELGGNSDASEAIVFYGYSGPLTDTILETCPEPRVDIARNINSSRSNKIVPVDVLVSYHGMSP